MIPPLHLYQLPTKRQLVQYNKNKQNHPKMSDELDILNELNDIDLSKVETSFPLLASGIVNALVTKCEYQRDTETKGADAKPYCLVEFAIQQPHSTVAHEGVPSKVLQPGDRGMTITQRVYVGKYEDKNSGELRWYGLDTLAKLREAAFGKAPEGTRFVPADMVGQTVAIKLKFDPAPKNKKTGETYGPRTEVDGYIRKK